MTNSHIKGFDIIEGGSNRSFFEGDQTNWTPMHSAAKLNDLKALVKVAKTSPGLAIIQTPEGNPPSSLTSDHSCRSFLESIQNSERRLAAIAASIENSCIRSKYSKIFREAAYAKAVEQIQLPVKAADDADKRVLTKSVARKLNFEAGTNSTALSRWIDVFPPVLRNISILVILYSLHHNIEDQGDKVRNMIEFFHERYMAFISSGHCENYSTQWSPSLCRHNASAFAFCLIVCFALIMMICTQKVCVRCMRTRGPVNLPILSKNSIDLRFSASSAEIGCQDKDCTAEAFTQSPQKTQITSTSSKQNFMTVAKVVNVALLLGASSLALTIFIWKGTELPRSEGMNTCVLPPWRLEGYNQSAFTVFKAENTMNDNLTEQTVGDGSFFQIGPLDDSSNNTKWLNISGHQEIKNSFAEQTIRQIDQCATQLFEEGKANLQAAACLRYMTEKTTNNMLTEMTRKMSMSSLLIEQTRNTFRTEMIIHRILSSYETKYSQDARLGLKSEFVQKMFAIKSELDKSESELQQLRSTFRRILIFMRK